MKKFELYLIKIVIGLIIISIAHKISDSFISGGIAGAIYGGVLEIIRETMEEDKWNQRNMR